VKEYRLERSGYPDKVFEIRTTTRSEFPQLWYENALVGMMVDEAERRRVTWSYLVNLGLNPDEIKPEDFVEKE